MYVFWQAHKCRTKQVEEKPKLVVYIKCHQNYTLNASYGVLYSGCCLFVLNTKRFELFF